MDALDGEPGVRSARYAGDEADYQANNRLLLERLRGVPADRRTARFRCAMILTDGQAVLAQAEGTVEGRIGDVPAGGRGFGYDPLFVVPPLGLTMAQLTPEQKHVISHRGQALRRLRDQLAALLSGLS